MKVLFLNHNNILSDVIPHFEAVTEISKAERIVVWSDQTFLERTVIKQAKERSIPTIVIQHGRSGSSRYYPPFNEPIIADKLLVFGEADKRGLIGAGQDPKKIKVVGTTLFSHLKPHLSHKGTNVVFSPDHWDKEIWENKATMMQLKKLKGIKLTTKIVDGNDPSLYVNPVLTNRDASDHIDKCIEILSTADLLVSISEGTLELLAQAMDIPVVVMEEWRPKIFAGDERYLKDYRRIISPASKRARLKNLNEVIKDQLARPNELQEERKRIVIDEGGYGLDSLNLIIKEVVS